jgi:protein TonB
VGLSVVGHVLAVGVWLVLGWAFAGPKIELDQKPIKASLVRLGKQRDEKLLPRKEEEPPPPPPKVEKVEVAAPAPPDTAVKIPTRDAKPDKSAPQKKSLFDALNKAARKDEELEGQADGDPDGDSARQEGERYYGLLTAVVKRNYDVSNTIDEAERRRLRAEVALRIGPSGELLDVDVTKASGNDLFDSAVLGAVKKAAPFTPPPEHLRDTLKKNGVAIVFTP